MNCRLPGRISASDHRDIEILHESRLAKCGIKHTHADKALQGGNIEVLVLGSRCDEDSGRCNFTAVRQLQNFFRAARAQAPYRSGKYELGPKQPRLLVSTLCQF